MQHDVFHISPQHTETARTVLQKFLEVRNNKPKSILTIAGEVGSGKSTIAHLLARDLKDLQIRAKIMSMDDFYRIKPLERQSWREKQGIDAVGFSEIDWITIDRVIKDFLQDRRSFVPSVDLITDYVDRLETNFKGVDVLIFFGLYSLRIPQSDLKVFIEHTYHETMEAQAKSRKEVIDDFRLKILEREHEEVMSLKKLADFYVDFDTGLEFYHL